MRLTKDDPSYHEVMYEKADSTENISNPEEENPEDEKNKTEPTQENEAIAKRADELRKQLRDNIKALKNRKRPLNVLILGKPLQGKSSFILSCTTAGLKKWGQYLNVGNHKNKSWETAYLRRFNVLDPQEDDEMIVREEGSDDDDETLLRKHCPRFFDLAGMPDENNKGIREVFRRILNGGIPLGTSLLEVIREMQGPNGPATIRKKYWKSDPTLRIDRIVVVMSTIEDHPSLLVEALMRAAQPKGVPDPDDGCIYRRTVPVFGLVTMMDKLKDMDAEELNMFHNRETELKKSLGLIGSSHHFGRCTNYFFDEEVQITRSEMITDPKKDCQILQFLDFIFDPNIKVEHEFDIPQKPNELYVYTRDAANWLNTLSTSEKMLAVCILIIAMLIFLIVVS